MAIRETQLYAEAILAPTVPVARETQVYVEAVIAPPGPPMRVTQCYVEAIIENLSSGTGPVFRLRGFAG